jgi:hypothetical protein
MPWPFVVKFPVNMIKRPAWQRLSIETASGWKNNVGEQE